MSLHPPASHQGDDLIKLARALSFREFTIRFAHPFLIIDRYDDEEEDFSSRFETGVLDSSSFGQTTLRPGETIAEAARRHESKKARGVYPVVKSARSPYRDRISVGRARTCDVVLTAAYVSKLHAHLIPLDGGAWEMRDAESTNGTFRNGKRLEANERVRILIGDVIRFGFLEAQFASAATAHTRLRRVG